MQILLKCYLIIVGSLGVFVPIHAHIQQFVSPVLEFRVADFERGVQIGPWSTSRLFGLKLIPLRVCIKNTGNAELVISQRSVVQPSKELVCALLRYSIESDTVLMLILSTGLVSSVRIIEKGFQISRPWASVGMILGALYMTGWIYHGQHHDNAHLAEKIDEQFLYTSHVIRPHEQVETVILIDKNDLWKPIIFQVHDMAGKSVFSYELPVEHVIENSQWHGRLKI